MFKIIKKILFPFSEVLNFFIKRKNNNVVYVPLLHNIYHNEMVTCKKLVKKIYKDNNVINPSEFKEVLNNKILNKRDNILITFDDGFYSNYTFAKDVLDPLNIKAIFFVCTDFIGINNIYKKNSFVIDKIFDGKTPQKIDQMWPMSWENLKELSKNGHTIGSHTKNHLLLSSTNKISILEDEIINSGNMIEDKLNTKIKHFAYPFGDIDSINKIALSIARKRYKYIHSGIRGLNDRSTSFKAIRRQSINTNEGLKYNKFIIKGGWSEYYKKDRIKIDSMVKE